MSSTNRSDKRRAADNYPTPGWVTRAILPKLNLGAHRVLEPACGEGAIIRELIAIGVHSQRIIGVDIRDDALDEVSLEFPSCNFKLEDFLESRCNTFDTLQLLCDGVRPGLVITNPPYSLAREFVERSLELVVSGGEVAMLLRLNFLGSQKRAAWFRSNTPNVYVLSRRPSFTNGGTDSCEYAWMIWRQGRSGAGSIEVLDVQPYQKEKPP